MRFTQILSSSQSQPHPTAPHQPRAALTPRRRKPGEIYGMIVRQARSLSAGLAAHPIRRALDSDALSESVDAVMSSLEESASNLLIFIERSTADDYLPGHLANVCVLSLATAQKMGLSKGARRAIGVGALLHDAGPGLAPQERLDRLKDFLNPLEPASRKVIENIVLQCQERISGLGPAGLRAPDIPPEAQLIGLCHDYETLSHPGPDHVRSLSHDVLRVMIEQAGETYEGPLLKKLWETLSLFPPGSFVRLSTGEMAKVLEIKDDDPVKPRVQIVADMYGGRVKEDRILDLSQDPRSSIECALDECAAKAQDPSLLLELKAQKWWMDS